MRARSAIGVAVVVIALSAAPARGERTAAANPRWTACGGEHPPDAPGFGKRIALTFDDGPSLKFTPRILSILRKHEAPATFFVVGHRIRSARARKLLREIDADPLFELGNHSFSHPRMRRLSSSAARREVDRTAALLARVDVEPRFFRFPYSQASCALTRMVRRRGYGVAGWHIDSADWCFAAGRGRCSPRMWKKVPARFRRDMKALVRHRAGATDGGILLLHDTHGWTADQLDDLLTALERDGYRFVRLSDPGVFPRLNREPAAP